MPKHVNDVSENFLDSGTEQAQSTEAWAQAHQLIVLLELVSTAAILSGSTLRFP